MSTIHLIGGEKGGVGKSVFARLLSQYFIDNTLNYIGLDADRSHATLSRSYEQFTRSINLDHFESTDRIMELALENDAHVLVDLPAQSERFLDRWIEENDVLGMCDEMGVTLVYWYLVDDGKDSLQLLDGFLSKYSEALNCIVVKNEGRGNDFTGVDAIIAKASAVIRTATLPGLHAPTMHKIDKYDFSFWGAANAKESGQAHLNLMERQRVKVWTRKAYALIDEQLASF